MKVRVVAMLTALALVMAASSAWAQSQTGDIFGKVTDTSGAVLPGRDGHPDRSLAAPAADRDDQRYRYIPVPQTERRHLQS